MTQPLSTLLTAFCLSLLVLGCSGGSPSTPSTPPPESTETPPSEPANDVEPGHRSPTVTPPPTTMAPPPPSTPAPEVPPLAPVRVPPPTPPPFPYTLVDLGAVIVRTLDVASRTVVGDVPIHQGQQAAILYPSSQLLGTLPGGVFSSAHGIAPATVVGEAGTGAFSLLTHAFRWTHADGMTDLGTSGAPNLFSAASAINAGGTIVGYGDNADRSLLIPLLWHEDQVTLLPTFGPHSAFAQAINATEHTVGSASTPSGMTHAVLWPPEGGIMDIHTTEGPFSIALRINQPGQIVGYAMTAHTQMGFLWLPLTGMLLLPPLSSDIASVASDINAAGIVVGQSTPLAQTAEDATSHAVRWVNGQPSLLMDLIAPAHDWVLLRAISINQEGAIVGMGTLNGVGHGFLLLPGAP